MTIFSSDTLKFKKNNNIVQYFAAITGEFFQFLIKMVGVKLY